MIIMRAQQHSQTGGGIVFRRQRRYGWRWKMCRWLKKKPRGIYRVLHSAAAIRRRRMVVGEKRKQYHKAYDYLRKTIRFLDYCEYRRNHLPIGSGVTEAACKTSLHGTGETVRNDLEPGRA